jgi:hypothetical protein
VIIMCLTLQVEICIYKIIKDAHTKLMYRHFPSQSPTQIRHPQARTYLERNNPCRHGISNVSCNYKLTNIEGVFGILVTD